MTQVTNGGTRILGVIAGTGLSRFLSGKPAEIATPYGKAYVVRGKVEGKPFVFLPRHGPKHTIPPHLINHPANLHALAEVGATDILSICAVGSVNKSEYKIGNLVVVRDFIWFQQGPTLFSSFKEKPMHAPMGEPYSAILIKDLKNAASHARIALKDKAVIGQTSGPRFETKGEVRELRRQGIDLVGMTSLGETIIANEIKLLKEIRNATLALVTNFGTGLVKKVNHNEVEQVVAQASEGMKGIVLELIRAI